jgi:hypothetical protein
MEAVMINNPSIPDALNRPPRLPVDDHGRITSLQAVEVGDLFKLRDTMTGFVGHFVCREMTPEYCLIGPRIYRKADASLVPDYRMTAWTWGPLMPGGDDNRLREIGQSIKGPTIAEILEANREKASSDREIAGMTLIQLANAIDQCLQEINRDPAKKPKFWFEPKAYRGGAKVVVKYDFEDTGTGLHRENAVRYLKWLREGNVGDYANAGIYEL